MLVKMKLYEKLALEHSHKFKGWEHRIISKDSFLEGIKAGMDLKEKGNEEVEVEIEQHQLVE